MTAVTIYSRRGCGACIFTERALELAGIPHRMRDIDTDDDAAATAGRISNELGTHQLPVVVCDDGQTWSGLQLHRVADLVRQAEELRRAWSADTGLDHDASYSWNRERHAAVLERIK